MYTGFRGKFTLKEETPDEVMAMLEWLVMLPLAKKDGIEHPPITYNAPLFSAMRWESILTGFANVYLEDEFPPNTSRLDGHVLTVSSSLKNYCESIQKFLDWVRPWVLKLEDGCYRYEEFDEQTLEFVDGHFKFGPCFWEGETL